MRLTMLAAAAAMLASGSASAQCNPGEELVFTCTSKSQKRILLCQDGRSVTYSYGKDGLRPDIVVSVPRNEASTTPWIGAGRFVNYSVDVPNCNTTYRVFVHVDRMQDDASYDAGVSILVNDQVKAEIKCSDEDILDHMYGIDLPETR